MVKRTILISGILAAIAYQCFPQWTQRYVSGSNDYGCIDYFSDTHIFIGGEEFGISTNGGASFSKWALVDGVGGNYYQTYLEDIHFFDVNTGVAVGLIYFANTLAILRTTNGGTNWEVVYTSAGGNWPRALRDLYFTSSSTGYAVGYEGRMMKTNDAGVNWTPMNSGTLQDLYAVWFTSASVGYCVGDQVILQTNNAGASWTLAPIADFLTDVQFLDANRGFAVGNSGKTWKTTDAGANWNIVGTGSGTRCFAINEDTLFSTTTAGIYKSIDGGQYWFKQPSSYGTLNDIEFRGNQKGVAVGNGALILTTSNAGDVILSNDVTINSMRPTSTVQCPGTYDVSLDITNQGADSLFSLVIDWQVNGGTINSFNWTGALPPYGKATGVVIGSVTMPSVSSTASLSATAKLPNGQTDQDPSDNQTTLNLTLSRMAGRYTIGGVNPNYATLQAAFADLASKGICNSVRFDIRPGTYNASVLTNTIWSRYDTCMVTVRSETGNSADVIIVDSAKTVFDLWEDGLNYHFEDLTIRGPRAIDITHGAKNVTILDNVFQGTDLTATNYLVNVGCLNGVFRNNTFHQGGIGLKAVGHNTTVEYNFFENQYQQGLIASTMTALIPADSLVVTGNNIVSNSSRSTYTGIEIFSPNFRVYRNKVNVFNGTGLNIKSGLDSLSRSYLFNNIINIEGGSNATGITVGNTNNVKVYYNSVRIKNISGQYTTGLVFNNSNSTNGDIRNNILSNESGGYALYVGSYGAINAKFRNNCYYSNGAVAIKTDSYSFLDDIELWSYQHYSDSNSFFLNPDYIGSELQIDLNRNQGLNGAAKPLPGFNEDFLGRPRHSSSPDVGAYEFDIPSNDAGINEFKLSTRICSGVDAVDVTIKNFGLAPLTRVTVNWKINGNLQTPYQWNGTLSNEDTSALFSIGSFNFLQGNTYQLTAWTSSPNGTADGAMRNDTLKTSVTAGGMSGTYTVGGAPADFPTIMAAVNALALNGVCDPVTLLIKTGTYSEPVVIPYIKGVSPLDNITFSSQALDSSKVIITQSTLPTVRLDSAHFVTFQHLTFRRTDSNEAIDFIDAASNIRITNSRIEGSIHSSGDFSTNHIVISHNRIITGWEGIELEAVRTGIYNLGITINDNYIADKTYRGIYVVRAKESVIMNNYVSIDSTPGSSFGIYQYGSSGPNIVAGNKVFGLDDFKGIMLESGISYPFRKALIYNNFVSAEDGDGIWSNTTFADIVFNSVLISGNGLPILGHSRKIENNVFANFGGGLAGNISAEQFNYSDYNIFYTSGPFLMAGNFDDYPDLVSWQQATGKDAHSFVVPPDFVSNQDLHIVNNFHAEGTANPYPNINIDIDGNPRNPLKPDIGADEFNTTRLPNDAGVWGITGIDTICSATSWTIKMKLKNFGSSTLTSAIIKWEVNGVRQPDYQWTGNLASDDTTDLFPVGNYTFDARIESDIKAWTTNPNGVADLSRTNDTLYVNHIWSSFNGTYLIGGTNSDYSTMAEAVDALAKQSICGAVIFNFASGVYSFYELTIPQIKGTSASKTITFQSLSGDSADVSLTAHSNDHLLIIEGADNLVFQHLTMGNGGAEPVIEINRGSKNLVFRNNEFKGADSFYSFINSDEFQECQLTCHNNTFDMLRANSINLGNDPNYTSNVELISNRCRSVNILQANSALIEHNSMNNLQLRYVKVLPSVGFNFLTGSISYERYAVNSSAVSWIHNNFMETLNLRWCTNVNVFNNSIQLQGQYPEYSMGIHIYSSSGIRLLNNHIVNSGLGYAIYLDPPTSVTESDYNNYYVSGTHIARYKLNAFDTMDFHHLDSIRAETGFEMHSVSMNPIFVNGDDLHTLNPLIDGLGKPIPGIDFDIDGDPRDAATPDIGADEVVNYLPYNAQLLSIEEPTGLCENGLNDVVVRIKNLGSTSLNSLNIHLALNGIQQPVFHWTGSLGISEVSDTIHIGSYSFPRHNSYVLKAWISNPNGQADMQLINDTLSLDTLYPAMSGAFTIGGASPDFATFTEAVQSLIRNGICDPVTFNVRDGIYNEQFMIPAIDGATQQDSIIFRSESGDSTKVTLQYRSTHSDSNYVFGLKNAKYITIKGFTIKPLHPYYAIAIGDPQIATQQNINIYNNRLIGTDSVLSTEFQALVNIRSAGPLRAINNYFLNGSWGIYSSGSSIKYNRFENQFSGGILSGGMISNNLITSDTTSASYAGIRVTGNGSIVRNNKIIGVVGHGIFAEAYGEIYNNFISIKTPSSEQLAIHDWQSGIVIYDEDYEVRIFNNTVISGSDDAVIYLLDPATGHNVRNNIFYNYAGGLCVQIWNIQSNLLAGDLDYNAYYTNGPLFGRWDPQTGYNDYTNLSSWVTGTRTDSHSVFGVPNIISRSDLHIISDPKLDGKGVTRAQVLTDIDGDVRHNLNPDIGADEFSSVALEAGMISLKLTNTPCQDGRVYASFANFGISTLVSATVNWLVNGIIQSPYNWTGALTGGNSSSQITLGTVPFQSGQTYMIKSWISNPNGATDAYPQNDTVQLFVDLNPTNILGNDTTICGNTLMLTTDQTYSTYNWSDGSHGSTYLVNAPGAYSITVTAQNGCLATDTILIDSCLLRTNISGFVRSPIGTPIRLAGIKAQGTETKDTITSLDGSYSIAVISNEPCAVIPSKTNDITLNNGITSIDILLTRRHIMGTYLSSPYKIIAADVNASNTVNVADVLLMRAVVLQTAPSFPGNRLWTFVRHDFVFSNPANPFPYDTARYYTSVSSLAGQNFIAMKLGDVNDTWDPNILKNERFEGEVSLKMHCPSSVQAGEVVAIPVTAKQFVNVSGLQFTLSWDIDVLTYQDVENGVLHADFATQNTSYGLLGLLWTDEHAEGKSLDENDTLFTVKFIANTIGKECDVNLNSAMIPIEAVNGNLQLLRLGEWKDEDFDKEFAAPFRVYQNYPNPFSERTVVSFELFEPLTISIEMYDVLEKILQKQVVNYSPGKHQIEYLAKNFSSGIYYLKFKTTSYKQSIKMIVTGK